MSWHSIYQGSFIIKSDAGLEVAKLDYCCTLHMPGTQILDQKNPYTSPLMYQGAEAVLAIGKRN